MVTLLRNGTPHGKRAGFRSAETAPSRELSPLDRFLNRAGALMDSLNRSGTEPGRATQILYDYCSKNDVGVRVGRGKGNNVVLRTPDGAEIAMHLGFIYDQVLPQSHRVSLVQAHFGDMLLIKQMLERGDVVYIKDGATRTIFPGGAGVFRRAVAKIRGGKDLDGGEAQAVPPDLRDQILKPVPLERFE